MEFRNNKGGLIDLEAIPADTVPAEMRARFDAALTAQRAARDTDTAARELVTEIAADAKARDDFAAHFAPRFRRTRIQEVRAMIAQGRPQLADAVAVVLAPHVEEGAPRDQDQFLSMCRQQDSAILGKQHQLRDLSITLRKQREHAKACGYALLTATPPMSHVDCIREMSNTTRLVKAGLLPQAGREFTALSYLDALGHAQGQGDENDFVRKQHRHGGFRRGASPVKQIPRFGIGAPEPAPVPVTDKRFG